MWSIVVTLLSLLGAFAFGTVVGWITYGILRRTKRDVVTDLITLIGALGGAAITALFPAETGAFGAYCLGLALGFFGYVVYAQRPNTPDWLGDTTRAGSQIEPEGLPPFAG